MTTIVAAFALTAGMVAHATGGRLASGALDREFAFVSTNSRDLPVNALFIALEGQRFDGHAFVPDVIARGAAGVLVARAPAQAGGAAVIVEEPQLTVERLADLLQALFADPQRLAAMGRSARALQTGDPVAAILADMGVADLGGEQAAAASVVRTVSGGAS